ncbi:hypothetical protein PC41400_08040 [Paenibacillus chitinolyticus]|uniref:Phage major capsid protein n=1 Tax=Paenibacillus chitinolyticus TaxID=79263 RepID=A0A410WSY7_9BACL|nr:hypothetical protein [Paenibacillus chitinolyticus]MCY9594037.1 hypothetical protein [Paenibacillus chitinolyticus]MCY9599142.1 hypothetical protein [Paenibacillus chitinolyticus]QAV17616.1 hypothetical protein PC41400_08040 [Paenibacillus chitinolyticus]
MIEQRILNCAVDAALGRSTDPKFTPEQRVEGMRAYLAELGKDYRRNEILINEVIEQTVDAILPIKITERLGVFADVSQVQDGVTKKWHVKNGKITAAYTALGVEQPRQKLYKGTFTTQTAPISGAVYAEYEDLITGRVDFADMINQLVGAIMDQIYAGIQDALIGAFGTTNNANRFVGGSFMQAEFDKLKGTVQAYGKPVIFGTAVGLTGISNGAGFDWNKTSEADRLDIRNLGHVGKYKGSDVVELPNSFTDETNAQKLLDDGYIYMAPVNADKPVKIVLEGSMHIRDKQERDWSTTKEYYRKAGISVLAINHMALYENSSL